MCGAQHTLHSYAVTVACKLRSLIDCNTHFIVVEIDEGQHKQYTKECEFSRMSNIYLANGLPTLFIRFNPDDFAEWLKEKSRAVAG